ncbi:MAG: methyltransferase [Bdellovibrionales bacterium]
MKHELSWQENGHLIRRVWLCESHLSPPKQVLVADDTLKADAFYAQASQGAGFLWRGDFQNAKQLLQAVGRRLIKNSKPLEDKLNLTERFHRHRQAQAHRAQLLARLLIPVENDFTIPLGRAPDVRLALAEALEPMASGFVMSLREILGLIGAHEWRKKGVLIPALNANIHPHYGIFSPVRGEYLDLIAKAPLPNPANCAFDIGTGTGVIAALLLKRGVPQVVATDLDPRALACARDNLNRLGLMTKVEIIQTDLFPNGRADLIVCNPPWVPAKPTSRVEQAIYDPDSRMLKSFLTKVGEHLTAEGEAWLILSDLAERLGLRSEDDLTRWILAADLRVLEVLTATPQHAKAKDQTDPLYEARAKEVTKLIRLKKNSP